MPHCVCVCVHILLTHIHTIYSHITHTIHYHTCTITHTMHSPTAPCKEMERERDVGRESVMMYSVLLHHLFVLHFNYPIIGNNCLLLCDPTCLCSQHILSQRILRLLGLVSPAGSICGQFLCERHLYSLPLSRKWAWASMRVIIILLGH